MPAPNRSRNTSRGFTLMEIVIAISILSIILTLAYDAVTKITQTKQLLDDQRDATRIANAALSRMTRELQLITDRSNLMPPADNLNSFYSRQTQVIGEHATLANGSAGDRITFVASEAGQYVPDGLTHSGIVQITYRVEADPDQEQNREATYYLIRDETPVLRPYEEAYKKRMTFPITSSLLSLRFRYFDSKQEQWVDEWDKERNQQPRIILFTIKIRSPRGEVLTYTTSVPVGGRAAQPPAP